MKNRQGGFTLIELLVVIAIIGILAALVLVALGNARDKANDARIKSNIGQLRTLAEVHYDANSASYASFGTCIGTPNATNCAGGIEDSVTSLTADTEEANGAVAVTAASDASDFCVSSPLRSVAATIVCVDASGTFTEGAQSCNATSFACQ